MSDLAPQASGSLAAYRAAGSGAQAEIPSRSRPRGLRGKSINTFSADHDWSRWKTYQLIRDGKLRAVRCGGRLTILSADEEAFEGSLPSK
jgi:hypothetical protein